MTTNEITQAARRKVLETTTEILSDETVLLYANQAYIDVYKKVFTGASVNTSTVVCTAGVCSLPTRYGRMYSFGQDNENNFLEEISIADFYITERQDVYTIEGGEIKIKDEDITGLTVKYYEKPETLTVSVDPSIDEYFHECIVYGTIWRLHEELQDEELATYFKGVFKDELSERIASQSNYEESNQRGGEMFIPQSLI